MKSLFIIGAHADTPEKEILLDRCIDTVKSIGFDIMVSSHVVLPSHIIKKINYYIYDSDNTFNTATGTYYWSKANNITITIPAKVAHDYPFIRNVRNALYTANANEYEFFYWTDFDNILSDEDINKLQKLKDDMVEQNKKFIFFKPENAFWQVDNDPMYGVYYETFLFGGVLVDFINYFDAHFPKSLDAYNAVFGEMQLQRPACAEHYMYCAFKDYAHQSIIIPQFVKEYLNTSRINQSTNAKSGLRCMILPSNTGKHYLYITNSNVAPYTFCVYINGDKIKELSLANEHIINSYELIELTDYCEINVKIYSAETLIKDYVLHYDADKFDEYLSNGNIHIG